MLFSSPASLLRHSKHSPQFPRLLSLWRNPSTPHACFYFLDKPKLYRMNCLDVLTTIRPVFQSSVSCTISFRLVVQPPSLFYLVCLLGYSRLFLRTHASSNCFKYRMFYFLCFFPVFLWKFFILIFTRGSYFERVNIYWLGELGLFWFCLFSFKIEH